MKRISLLIIGLLHFLVLIQDCVGGKSSTDLINTQTKGCKLDVLVSHTGGATVWCDDDNGNDVTHLATCEISTYSDGQTFKCSDGEWSPVYNAYGKGTDSGIVHHRQKRFIFSAIFFVAAAALGAAIAFTYCHLNDDTNWHCKQRDRNDNEERNSPTYSNCPPTDIQTTYTAEEGSKTVKVTWSNPVVQEKVSNELTCCGGYKNGDNFPALPGTGYRHTMVYTATDDHGLTATCSFSFTALYLTCDEPIIPENSKQGLCTQGHVYGSTCSLSCNTGYEMTGNSDVTCQASKTWTSGPTCSKIECPAPSGLDNGNTVCDSSTTYTYDDDCTFVCNDGFKLNGPLKMTCQADKTWSVDMDQISCTDSESPVISCQSPQVFYADRGTFSTSVLWKGPTADDTFDANPSITKIEGSELGDELQAGLHYVRYRATDSENNSSPPLSECTITLDVKVIKCSTGPTDALINSRFMTYNCSDTSFYNGVTCQLRCDLNLPLNGTDLMTCERDGTTDQGFWNWGSGSQPYCKVVECPKLDPPYFGSLGYDTINARPVNVMLCQEGYDISSVGSSFTGRMSCQDSGTWYPLDAFPDCIEPCPRGTYLNFTTGNCEYCNIGEYMDHDGAALCDSCPDGYSTLSTGSKNVSKCTRKCPAGFQSSTTMEPCSACPIGTYQNEEGKTTCTICPLGEITPSTNSTSVDQCGSFDLFVSGLDGMKEMANFNTSANDVLTLVFWLKLQVKHSPNLTVQLTDTSGLAVALSFTDVLGITVGSSIYEINNVPLSHQKWTYIACTIDATSQQFKLYKDNTLVLDETNVQLDSSVPLGESSLSVTTSTLHGVYLSAISAFGRVLTAAEMSDLIKSCSVSIGDEIMTMEDVKNKMTGEVVVVTPSVCDAINECASLPCGTNTCINEVNGFTCVCRGGMTGALCDIPPDYCEDNECYHGNCIPGNETYTCDCKDGYSGVFCSRGPVDGGWSVWGEWSDCDVECNGGTRQRNRSCNNPSPEYMGIDCQGNGVETETCNTAVCPECPTLKREPTNIVTCSYTDPEVTVCNITCTDGTTLPNGQTAFEEYRCGKVTAYEWTPGDKLPVCVVYSKPMQLGYTVTTTLEQTVTPSSEEDYITHVQDGLSDVECVQSGQCGVRLSHSSSQNEMSNGSTVTIQFTIVMTDQGELSLSEYLANGTTTSSMSELIGAVNTINNVSTHIQANMVSIFSGEAGGVQYTVDTGSLVATTLVYCDDGYAGTDGMCVQCPAGTRYTNGLCISCDVRTYQSLSGQSSCITCPYGYTTKAYGSNDVADCSVVSKTSTEAPTSTPPAKDQTSATSDTKGLSNTIIIGICFSVAAFILSSIAIGCVLWKNLARRNEITVQAIGSQTSLDMNRPPHSNGPAYYSEHSTLSVSDIEIQPPAYEGHGLRETPEHVDVV